MTYLQHTHRCEDDPESVHGHFATNNIRYWIHQDHSHQLSQGLHSSPKGSVVCLEVNIATVCDETNMVNEALVGNDVSLGKGQSVRLLKD